MSRRPDTGSRRLSPEEQRLRRHVTRDVSHKAPPPAAANPAATPEPTSNKPSRKPANRLPVNHLPPSVSAREPPLSHGVAPGLERATARKMKRGKLDIDATLDLHGHTQTAAFQALASFLERAAKDGRRAVRVITGKGSRSGGRLGVLQGQVPAWLNEMPMRQWVNAFSYAAAQDGGTGALYILVKRRKSGTG